jgi:DNA-binding GntR family transcriptional regulator
MNAGVRKSLLKKGGSMPDRVARHHVREEIQRRILSGESQPGERLSQQSLARELGVAQGTVRESLFELQWLGLVESIDRLGVFVGKLDVERICQAYQVRAVLEGLASRLSCHNAGRADITKLRSMAEDVYKLAKREKEDERGRLDREFHFHIIKLSRNDILIRLAESYRILGMTVRASREQQRIYEEHLAIVDAIEHDRPDDAERIARLHVTEAARRIEAEARQGNFIPKWVD